MNDTGSPEGHASVGTRRAGAREGSGPPEELARRYRSEFPIFDRKIYLNSNSLGALSRRSIEARRTFERQWNRMGAGAWYGPWLEKLDEVRAGFGRTVGAGAGSVALVPSVSAGLTAVADALDFGDRDTVVVSELDFPTLLYQFLARRRSGLRVEVVQSPDGVEVPPERWVEAVDERTALVATSHVFFTTGAIQDAGALARIAHDSGALFLLDAYQSNGQIPIDVEAIGADFLLSGALKWLLGGPGLAYLYVRPGLVEELEPRSLSWFGVENQFAFDPAGATPRPDARRFEMGTPAVGAAFTAAGGLEIVEEVGIEAIRARNASLTEDLLRRLREAGFGLRVAPSAERRSAVVLVRHPEPEAAVRRLADRGIVVDARPGHVRISPHFYNTSEDGERVVAALREHREEGGQR
ncbi:MAG: aminotransferase class V-fold PLP-dependent enzyme [Gemmatimonadota bacterium]